MTKEYELEKHSERIYGAFSKQKKTQKVVLDCTGSAVPYMKERTWGESQEIKQNEDGTLVISFVTSQMYPLEMKILSFGGEIKPIEPPNLVESCVKCIRKLANNTGFSM